MTTDGPLSIPEGPAAWELEDTGSVEGNARAWKTAEMPQGFGSFRGPSEPFWRKKRVLDPPKPVIEEPEPATPHDLAMAFERERKEREEFEAWKRMKAVEAMRERVKRKYFGG